MIKGNLSVVRLICNLSNAHAQPSSGARSLAFCLKFSQVSFIVPIA